MTQDKQQLIHTLRHAAEEMALLRSQLSAAEKQLRIVSIFERAMFGPTQSQFATVDAVWSLKRLADQIEKQDANPVEQESTKEVGA